MILEEFTREAEKLMKKDKDEAEKFLEEERKQKEKKYFDPFTEFVPYDEIKS
jgi:hypothetical protein